MVALDTELTLAERGELVADIASRKYTGGQLAIMYETTIEALEEFIEAYRDELERAVSKPSEQTDEPTPQELDELWISNKFERLKRYQSVAEDLYNDLAAGSRDSTTLRELRSYLLAVANELGQLMHRGAGDGGSGDILAVEIPGVDMESMK